MSLSFFYSAPRGYNALRCDHQGQFAFFAPRPNCAHTGASGITTVFSEDRAQPGSSGRIGGEFRIQALLLIPWIIAFSPPMHTASTSRGPGSEVRTSSQSGAAAAYAGVSAHVASVPPQGAPAQATAHQAQRHGQDADGRGLVDMRDGVWHIVDPLFEEWLRRSSPLADRQLPEATGAD